MSKDAIVRWLPDVADHDYAAAESYLCLIYKDARASALIGRLKGAAVGQFQAKDIFRASALSLLGVSNSHVDKERQKVVDGAGLSPLLLVRDEPNGKVVVADGYHRLCAIYEFDEDASIRCKIV
jgi:hypothetical protein